MHTTAGDIILELDPVHAPITTANFLDHASRGDCTATIGRSTPTRRAGAQFAMWTSRLPLPHPSSNTLFPSTSFLVTGSSQSSN
jgi:hypothetical protein